MTAASAKTTADLAAEYGLKPEEYARILLRLNREPNPVELGGVFGDVVRALLLQVLQEAPRQIPHHRPPA